MSDKFYKIGVRLALEKIAKFEDWERTMLGLGSGLGVQVGGSLLLPILPILGFHLERRLTPSALYKEIAQKLPEVMQVPKDITVLRDPGTSYFEYRYSPDTKEVFVDPDPSPAGLAHELGHATGLGRRPAWMRAVIGGRHFAHDMVLPAIMTQAFTDPDSLIGKAVPYVPAVAAAPALAEEVRASAKALKGLYRAGGRGAMLRGLLPLVPAFGTYGFLAASPFIGGALVKHLIRNE